MKKFCILLSSLFAMSQCCANNIETYVFGTDKGYLCPTIQAIYSLNTNTPSAKRIIVLEMDDVHGTPDEATAFGELTLPNGTTLLRWKLSKLLEQVDPALMKHYTHFRNNVDARSKHELITTRVLFPTIFSLKNLTSAGYANDLGNTAAEQTLKSFVSMDSDILARRNMSDFYTLAAEASKEHLNSQGIEQPIVSTDLHEGVINCGSTTDTEKNRIWTSGGVIFWNLEACRKLLETPGNLTTFVDAGVRYEELSLNVLLKGWLSGGILRKGDSNLAPGTCFTADKIWNINIGEWLEIHAYNAFWELVKARWEELDDQSSAGDHTRKESPKCITTLRLTWTDAEPVAENESTYKHPPFDDIEFLADMVEISEDGLAAKKPQKPAVTPSEIRKTGHANNIILLFLALIHDGIKIIEHNFLRHPFLGSKADLCRRINFVTTTEAVLHWDQAYKPWNTIVDTFRSQNQTLRPDTMMDLLAGMIRNATFNLADVLWILNLQRWMTAEDIKDEAKKRKSQTLRSDLVCNWLKTLQ